MKKIFFPILLLFVSILLFAQEKSNSTQANLSKGELLVLVKEGLQLLKEDEKTIGHHHDHMLPAGTELLDLLIDENRIAFYLRLPDHFLAEIDEHFFEEIPLRLFNLLPVELGLKSFEIRVEDEKGDWVPLSDFYVSDEKYLTPTPLPKDSPGDGGLPIYSSDDPLLYKNNPVTGQGQPSGALSGKTVWLSPGHGWLYYTSLSDFSTQRGETNDMVEDFGTIEGIDYYLLKYLWNAGANVWMVRERDYNENEVIVDNTQAGYAETGAWSTTSNTGFNPATNNFDQANGYRFSAATTGAANSSATWTPNIPKSGWYWVSTAYRSSSDRPIDAQYEVNHAGGTTAVGVNQEVHGETFVYLGQFYFDAGTGGSVTLLNSTTDPAAAQFVIADAMRFGGGTGTELDCTYGTGPTSKPRWEECARMYAPFMGYPTCRGDVTMRPHYAEWELAKGTAQEQNNACYVSWHSNAATGTARGTVTYAYDGSNGSWPVTPGSYDLQGFVHDQLAGDIIDCWDGTWNDRGTKVANFGELRELQTMPGCLVEVAFHDNAQDAQALTTPRFREIAARGIYHGIVEYFADKDATTPTYFPDPPTHCYAKNSGANQITLTWQAPIDECGTEAATGYSVYMGTHGRAFADAIPVSGTSYTFSGLNPSTAYYFRVAATNAGGESFPSAVVAAKTPDIPGCAPDFLIVDGFDRIDRSSAVRKTSSSQLTDLRRLFIELMNSYDYMADHAQALDQCNMSFDGCANEVVIAGTAILTDYKALDWYTGEESTVDNTFDATERSLLQNYLDNDGCLIVSGAEIGWDIGRSSSSNADLAFYNNYLKAAYVGDDGGTYNYTGAGAGIFSGINGAFDDNTNCYFDAEYPDRLASFGGSTVDLTYNGGTGDGAATVYSGADFAVVYFGFPLETCDPASRDALMCNAVDFLNDHLGPPVANCTNLTIPLNAATGTATITAEDVDATLLGNCELTGSLSQTVFTCADIGSNSIDLTVSDAASNSATCNAVITVTGSSTPVAICPAAPVVLSLSASGTVSLPANSLGDGSSTNNCGTVAESNAAVAFNCGDVGTQSVALTASNQFGGSNTVNCNITIQDVINPLCSAQNITVQLNAAGNASISAAQINNNSTDECGIANVSLDVSSFTCSDLGTNPVVLTVTDNNGLSANCNATVTVEDNVNPNCLTQNQTIQLDASGNATITANQINNGSSDACGIAGMSLDITTFDCTDVGTNTVMLTVSDASGNSSTCPATVTVQDISNPVCMSQAVTAFLDASGSANITAAQVDNNSSDACGIASISINQTAFNCSNIGGNTVTLTVNDHNGISSNCTASLIVVDNMPPTITCPSPVTVTAPTGQCFASGINLGTPITNDNCSVQSVNNNAPSLFGVGTTVVTWTATDQSGQSASCQQNVTVNSSSFSCTDDGDCSNGDEVYNTTSCLCEQVNIPDPSTCVDDGDCSNGDETWNTTNCTCEQLNIPDPSTCVDDGICSNGSEVWNNTNCTCEQLNIPNSATCINDGICANGQEVWDNTNCTCTQQNVPNSAACMDDGVCSNGDEVWNNTTCVCEQLNVPNAAACVDDGICSNGDEIWNNTTCNCDQVNIPDPTVCMNDGVCGNGVETWNNSTCICEQLNIPDPTTCMDDGNCSNGTEVWNSASCTCDQINVPDPLSCTDDGDCSNGDEFWSSNTCQCIQINVPNPAACVDDGVCGNGEETWNNANCNCEQLNVPDPATCQDDGLCVNGTEIWNSSLCQCIQINIPDASACTDDNVCSNGDEFWNSSTCQCEQLNIPDPNSCVSDADCVNGVETWNNSLCICEALNPLGDSGFASPNTSFCPTDGAVVLIPQTNGGVFSGPGVSGNIFDPTAIPMSSWGVPVNITYTLSNAGCSTSSSQQFTVSSCAAPVSNVRIKIFLEGNYTGNGMHNQMFAIGVVPFNQPYAGAPWNASYSSMALAPPTTTVDWVLVEAYTGTPNSSGSVRGLTQVESQAGFLLTNGNIVSNDGTTGIDFQNLTQGEDYYFIVRHRNHLDVLTAVPATASNVVNYDFTLSPLAAFGIEQVKLMSDGKYALHAGDYNHDAVIQNTDYDDWFVDPSILNMYELTDGNLDGVVQTTDYDTWFLNKAKIGTFEVSY